MKAKPKVFRGTITLRPGDSVLVRCRRHRDDDDFDDNTKRRSTRVAPISRRGKK